ncbi:hypothetical protein X793_03630 [Dehalococcoides mccartyi CG4]|uniref:hypothetical protein n=1 Tax=Dehalococcoides mccartyi TaxID=61435 RepID=UPI0004E045F5|nr:hypothetical protein [Dehalococcoides mccartyi]AII60187.1 hypothetical protein X793_03630 [Dehalococcoides mccartyi CG4]
MSLLTKSGGGLSGLAIDADKDWQGRLIKNLGLPVNDADALRKQDAILKALLTQAGQLLYASGPGTPAVLAPDTGEKFLKAGAPPSWAGIPAGGFWELAGETTLGSAQGTIEVTGLSTAYEILWIQFMSTWSHGWDVLMRLNGDAGPSYDYSRYLFSSVYGHSAFDNDTEVTMYAPGGEGQVFYQLHGFIFQRLANWRKTFCLHWYPYNSANGSNSFYIYQGYWNNQSSKVTGVRFQNGGSFDAQARLLVLGAR